MSNKMISLFSIGKTQQIEQQVVNNFDLDIKEVKGLLDELRNDFFDRLKLTEGNITESMAEQISRTIECKFIEVICKVNEMPSVTEEKVKQAVQQGFYMLRENSDAFLSDLQNQFDEIKDRELSLEENLTNLCNQIAWQSDEAFNSLFEMVAPLKNIKWDFSYELREGWSCLKRADFGHAKELFAKATGQKDIMAEAYFGLALADCTIQIIWDYKNCRMQPLCYDYSIEFPENPHYKLALENAAESQKNEYKNFAKEIEHIQKEFEYLESSGLDYDCFICVKVSAKDGEKTEDSKDADNIYHLLQRKGHKPFYSDYEIRNKKGAEYEAHILYALYKSKCMLLVCRNKEYLRTPWVKNEYMRFMKMIEDGEKKRGSLVIVFYGKRIERLPGRPGRLEGIDFAERGSEFEIVEFVDRQTQKETEQRKAEAAAEAVRLAEERRKAEEEARKAEEQRKAEAAAEAARLAEEQRKAEAAAEAARLAEERRKAEAAAEAARLAEERRKAEAAAEAARLAEERRKAEEAARKAEEQRKAEAAAKIAEERKKKPWLASDYPTLEHYDESEFEIEGTKLIAYLKKDFSGEVKIPRGVKSIGGGAFDGCSGLTSVIIPDSVTSIGHEAFYDCSGLISIIIPDSVTSIGDWAFKWCSGLTSITIPANVTTIGEDAFHGCSGLTLIIIPANVTSIGEGAFGDCSQLTKIEVDENNRVYHAEGNCLIETKSKTLISGCKTSKIPDSVKSIGQDAFYGCSGLTSITIPKGVTSIGDYAFRGCSGLTSITIPESVISIGDGAFNSCSGLTKIEVDENNPIYHAEGNCLIETASKTLISGCKTSKIPQGVTSIERGAFYGCSGLTSITIPNSVKSIGWDAFEDCSGLTSITIPDGVKSIGDYAFRGCSGLTSITIPDGVKSICFWAFKDCKNLLIYCEARKKPIRWNRGWNPDNRPVVWGYKKK